jgi:transposase-like protein
MTTEPAAADPFPCPFCRGTRVALSGKGRTFVHYRCSDCAEVWTAMSAKPRLDAPQRSTPLAASAKH